jgi:hypothetical protein
MIFDNAYKRLLTEATFRKSKQVEHLYDVPMFSIFAHKELLNADDGNDLNEVSYQINNRTVKRIFSTARKIITSMGFPSMHANVVFKDLNNDVNRHTGGKNAGYATRQGKYMVIDYNLFLNWDVKMATSVIVHEWAHLYMYNNSKGFKTAVKEFYKSLQTSGAKTLDTIEKSKMTTEEDRTLLMKSIDIWVKVFDQIISEWFLTERPVFEYLLAKNKININDSKMIPHLFDIWGTLNQDITMETRSGKKALFPKGTRVGFEKIIYMGEHRLNIHEYKNNERYEMWINNSNYFWKYMDNPEQEFKKALEDYKTNYKTNTRNPKEDIKKEITDMLSSGYKQACKILNIPYSSEFPIYVSENIVTPKFLEYLDNDYKLMKVGRPYDILWMNNNLKPDDLSFYNNLVDKILEQRYANPQNLAGTKNITVRETMKNLVGWVDAYGMSNDDEIWATGIEKFFKLKPEHRKAIIKLMSTTGERLDPNRSKRKMLRKREVSNRKIQ